MNLALKDCIRNFQKYLKEEEISIQIFRTNHIYMKKWLNNDELNI